MKITDDMLAAARRAAIDRMMSEGGCPEGEAMRAALEAVAPLIAAQARREALEEAAALIERKWGSMSTDAKGRPMPTAHVPVNAISGFAAAIRALIEKEHT